ncbi:MAG: sulfotransferase [Woeseiaceae bacterium]|nr:sulfotransferase [Woeseiaceae bacterium]
MFRHLHIVACSPRTGTTLLHEVMVTCLKVDKHYDHEIRFHLVTGKDGETVITKRPKDTMYMPAVLDDDPELFVIYLLRDPRDTICSRHGKDKSIYYSNIRLWRQMHGYARQMAGHERFLEVRYEDFVRDPDATQQMIADKFPWLESTHRFSEYHEYAVVSEKSRTAMHSVRPIAPTSVGVWTRNPGRIKAQQMIHGSLTPELIECGYESSGDWERVLDGVEPDTTRSLYPENLALWRRISQALDARRKVARYRRMRRKSS